MARFGLGLGQGRGSGTEGLQRRVQGTADLPTPGLGLSRLPFEAPSSRSQALPFPCLLLSPVLSLFRLCPPDPQPAFLSLLQYLCLSSSGLFVQAPSLSFRFSHFSPTPHTPSLHPHLHLSFSFWLSRSLSFPFLLFPSLYSPSLSLSVSASLPYLPFLCLSISVTSLFPSVSTSVPCLSLSHVVFFQCLPSQILPPLDWGQRFLPVPCLPPSCPCPFL